MYNKLSRAGPLPWFAFCDFYVFLVICKEETTFAALTEIKCDKRMASCNKSGYSYQWYSTASPVFVREGGPNSQGFQLERSQRPRNTIDVEFEDNPVLNESVMY